MPTTSKSKVPARRAAAADAVCVAAVDAARAAVHEVADPAEVGEHLGVEVEGVRTVTHRFEAQRRGYRGWSWAVTVARAPRMRAATVSEVVLLPGTDAVLAPAWVPWADRIAPGDLGPADVLPRREDDPCLEPGYEAVDDDESDRLALWELGLGRPRVLSPAGRALAAERWHAGEGGPLADRDVPAADRCAGCGYLVRLAGALRGAFGVCGNEWSPSDGRVVSLDHGCGAHSETDVPDAAPEPLPPLLLDDLSPEAVELTGDAPGAATADGDEAAGSAR